MHLLTNAPLFSSFFLAGFECSSQRRADGRRLDLLAATGHDRTAPEDYRQLAGHGIRAARDGLRWHLIEASPGRYDWSSFLPMLRAARDGGTQVAWDLCHYGWPDGLDIWSPAFVGRFARFAAAAARVVRDETAGAPIYCPVNEISYWAWAGGDVGRFNPGSHGRGYELKCQLVRASIAAIEAIRAVDPRARFITAEPLIHVSPGADPKLVQAAETSRLTQFEAFDMLVGAREPGLGGHPSLLDVVGVNYYPENQWYYGGSTLPMGHHAYRPLSDMLAEAQARYGRPLLVAETGAEGSGRAAWLHYVCAEVRAVMDLGVPVEGVTCYPILEYPGWDDERACPAGLLSEPDAAGRRTACAPVAQELRRQQAAFADWGRRGALRKAG